MCGDCTTKTGRLCRKTYRLSAKTYGPWRSSVHVDHVVIEICLCNLLNYMSSYRQDGPLSRSYISSAEIRFRLSFVCCRLLFSANARSLAPRVLLVGIRLAGTRFNVIKRRASRSNAFSLFRCWDRESAATTTTPEGPCVNRTADSVTFLCCPPGPPAR